MEDRERMGPEPRCGLVRLLPAAFAENLLAGAYASLVHKACRASACTLLHHTRRRPPLMLAHGRTRLLTRWNHCIRHAHAVRAPKEDSRWPGWELVVGIEVHAQIKSRRKLFSGESLPSALSLHL